MQYSTKNGVHLSHFIKMEETNHPISPSSSSSPSVRHRIRSAFCLPFRKPHLLHNQTIPFSCPSPKATKDLESLSDNSSPLCERDVVSRLNLAGAAEEKRRRGSRTARAEGAARGGIMLGQRRRRRSSVSADFSYDALSYSLNFDDGTSSSMERRHLEDKDVPFSPREDLTPSNDVYEITRH